MRILALICARGGSKRIPCKNIRILGGKPLIVWTIAAARRVPQIRDVLVSTDDPKIARVAKAAGALVPWLRPAALATDTASSVDVCLHALEWFERAHGKVDGLLLLQPTSPFRRRKTLIQGCKLFKADNRRTVICVSPAEAHPLWCFRIEQGRMRPFIESKGLKTRSQDLPAAFVVNGAFFLITPERLRQQRSFYGGEMTPLIAKDPLERLDLDTKWDWKLAAAICPENGKGCR